MTLAGDRQRELLGAAPLFADVSAEGLARISERAESVELAEGHVIARQGEIGSGLFVIVTGLVRIVRDGRELNRLGPGDFFGELSVLDGRPRTANVIAAEPTTCLALATWDVEAVVTEDPSIAMALLRGLAGRLRDLTEADRH